MDKKTWIIFGIIVIGILGYFGYQASQNKLDVSKIDTTKILTASPEAGQIGDHFKGKKEAKKVVIEYADFECPACAGSFKTIKNTIANNDQAVLVFRHFPIPGHPNAKAAAAASEAAGLQGKFWQMAELLYQNQADWSSSVEQRTAKFEQYAKQLDLDLDKFKTDLASDAVNKKIKFDTALAVAQKVTATPTIIVNGQFVEPEVWSDPDQFSNLLNN